MLEKIIHRSKKSLRNILLMGNISYIYESFFQSNQIINEFSDAFDKHNYESGCIVCF